MTRLCRRQLVSAALAVIFAIALTSPAANAWEPEVEASDALLASFHDHFALAAYPYPKHAAAPLGVPGFEFSVDATYNPDFDEQPFFAGAVDGDLDLGFLTIARARARVGLPFGIDVGAALAKVPDADGLDLASAEVQWAVVKGGALTPALAVRVTGQRTLDPDRYELEQWGAEVMLSKGFTLVTPYIGAGIARSTSRFDRAGDDDFELETDETLLYGGVTLNLLIPKLTVEVERGETWQAALRVGFGL